MTTWVVLVLVLVVVFAVVAFVFLVAASDRNGGGTVTTASVAAAAASAEPEPPTTCAILTCRRHEFAEVDDERFRCVNSTPHCRSGAPVVDSANALSDKRPKARGNKAAKNAHRRIPVTDRSFL